MRITIVTGPWFPVPPGPAGAVERIWADLAERFAAAGHTVTLISRAFEGLPSNEARAGVVHLRIPGLPQSTSIYRDIAKDALYSARALRHVPPSDITVANAFWLPLMLKRLAPRAGAVVANVQRVPKGQLRLYRRVDRLAAVSHAIVDAITAEAPSLAPRVRLIPNPIDLAHFAPPTTPRRLTPAQGGTRTILYTGRINPEKGLHVLARAFASLHAEFPDLKLKLVGPSRIDRGGGGPDYINAITTAAAGAPVEIHDPIYDRKALADLLRHAAFYCYPSLAEKGESFGVAPLEAMATALAPVVSDLPCFRDFIRPGENGLVFNHRAQDPAAELAAALRALITDPARAASMGHQGAADARRFDNAIVARQYLDDFATLLPATRP